MTLLTILRELIRIDTQNPPGNEGPAVGYIASLCRRAGLEYRIRTYNGNRSSIIVRLAPRCEDRLVILGHLDVVRADETAWDCAPFGAEIRNGYLYGRGALDMKYFISAALAVLVDLKPREAELKRGLTAVFTADEENGSAYGLPRLLEEESIRDELSGRIVFNEGGGFTHEHHGTWYSLVETGQKSVARLRVTVPELPGTNAYFPTLNHEKLLVRSAGAVQGAELRRPIPETARILVREITGIPLEAVANGTLDEHVAQLEVQGDVFLSRLLYAMTHNTITPTILRGGSRHSELDRGVKGEIDFDCRLLPGITPEELSAAVHKALDDLPVRFTLLFFSPGYETIVSHPLIEAMEQAIRRQDPNIAACLPFLTPGANDGRFLHPLGCKVLGFAPLSRSQPFKEVIALIHGVNERICIDSLTFCGEVIADICRGYVEGVSPDAR